MTRVGNRTLHRLRCVQAAVALTELMRKCPDSRVRMSRASARNRKMPKGWVRFSLTGLYGENSWTRDERRAVKLVLCRAFGGSFKDEWVLFPELTTTELWQALGIVMSGTVES